MEWPWNVPDPPPLTRPKDPVPVPPPDHPPGYRDIPFTDYYDIVPLGPYSDPSTWVYPPIPKPKPRARKYVRGWEFRNTNMFQRKSRRAGYKRRRTASRGVKRVRVPVSYGRKRRTIPGRMSTRKGCLKISHREYIGRVQSTGDAFNVSQNMIINPGCIDTFPWLNKIAQNFESYTIDRMSFVYEPECATSTVGSICMVCDPDVQDPAPIQWSDVVNAAGSVSGSVFLRHQLGISSSMLGRYKKRHVDVGAADRHEDIGRVYVCLESVAAGNVGRIYVDYSVCLYTPQPSTHGGSWINWSHVGDTTHPTSFSQESGNPPVTGSCTAGAINFVRGFKGSVIVETWDAAAGISAFPTCVGSNGATCVIQPHTYNDGFAAHDKGAFTAILGLSVYDVTAPVGGTITLTTGGATAAAFTSCAFLEANVSVLNDAF